MPRTLWKSVHSHSVFNATLRERYLSVVSSRKYQSRGEGREGRKVARWFAHSAQQASRKSVVAKKEKRNPIKAT